MSVKVRQLDDRMIATFPIRIGVQCSNVQVEVHLGQMGGITPKGANRRRCPTGPHQYPRHFPSYYAHQREHQRRDGYVDGGSIPGPPPPTGPIGTQYIAGGGVMRRISTCQSPARLETGTRKPVSKNLR